jgi:hypothetical protein
VFEEPGIADERGLFLEETWRLHPDICRLTSELFYDRRLKPLPSLERQAILGPVPIAGYFSGGEFAPGGGAPRLHQYTGVLTLLGSA